MQEMPHDELMCWIAYFDKRPLGWREDLRTYYLLQAQGVKVEARKIFPTLGSVISSASSDTISSLRKSFLYQKMKSAKGGDKLDFI